MLAKAVQGALRRCCCRVPVKVLSGNVVYFFLGAAGGCCCPTCSWWGIFLQIAEHGGSYFQTKEHACRLTFSCQTCQSAAQSAVPGVVQGAVGISYCFGGSRWRVLAEVLLEGAPMEIQRVFLIFFMS